MPYLIVKPCGCETIWMLSIASWSKAGASAVGDQFHANLHGRDIGHQVAPVAADHRPVGLKQRHHHRHPRVLFVQHDGDDAGIARRAARPEIWIVYGLVAV